MKKFLIAGLMVIIVPLLGIPMSWKTGLLFLTGLFIIWHSFTYKKKNNKEEKEENEDGFDKVYIENEKNTEE